ncbi:phage tail protein [Sulfurovum sp. bin170]|uniref:phage tail protein n=1 Tax=Sulfurovum sp. bin170 TaxID=2695268 RepID=UPI0013DF4BD9|nr:phage tail protein [Sulfurovum sp. bin170]NEW60825.1 phage tail protein [Sulfurovum sp. bin170]
MAQKNPYKNYRFLLEIDGLVQAGFKEVTIPDSSQDPIEYREGNDQPTVRKIPGLIKYGNISLKVGLTDSMELYEWRKLVEDGKTDDYYKNMAIILIDEQGESKSRWEFSRAWPTKYDAPDLNATDNNIAIESIDVAHEGMKRVK